MNHRHSPNNRRSLRQTSNVPRLGAPAGLSSSAGKCGVPLLACPAVRSSLSLIPLLCWSLALLLLVSAATVHAQVRYVYDESGRLVQVIGLDGKSTRYRYDAAGNIISMTQDLAGALVISEFTPNRGPIGTTVTISGVGFSTTVSANIVKFNGVTAVVSTATATTLVTKVPTGATTGPIMVTVGTKVATSAAPFTITTAPDNGIPVITSFTPRIGLPGAAVAISGNNFSTTPTNNLVYFHLTRTTVGSSNLTTINTTIPTGATSGPIKVRTATGTATSATDFFVVPTGYTAADISVTQRTTVNGPALAINTGTAGKIAMVLFEGTQGQYLGLGASPVTTTGGSATLYIKTPSGGDLMSSQYFSSAFSTNLPRLPETGFYTMLIVSSASAIVNATLTLSTDIAGDLTANGAATLFSTTRLGQNGRYTFTGTTGQHLGLGITNFVTTPANQNVEITVYKPDGTVLKSCGTSYARDGGDSCDLPTLPATGTYTVWVNNGPWASTLKLWLSPDGTGTLTLNGAAKVFTTTRAGQNARYTFAGTAGQNLSLAFSGDTFPGYTYIYVYRPDGTQFTSTSLYYSGGAGSVDNLSLSNLPSTGTYTVLITPSGPATGTISTILWTDATGTVAINGAATAVSLPLGRNGRYTFAGTAGQTLGLGITDLVTTPADKSVSITVYKPDGTALKYCGLAYAEDGGDSCDLPLLPTTGTYTVWVDNGVAASTFKLWLSADKTATLTLNGATPTTFTTTRVGQNARYTFTGTAGQNLSLVLSGDTFPGTTYIYVYRPDGTQFTSTSLYYSGGAGSVDNLSLSNLPSTGTYTVLITPSGPATGTISTTLWTDATGTVAINGAATAVSLPLGRNGRYTFAGTAGQHLGLGVTNLVTTPADQRVSITVYKPDGTTLVSCGTFYASNGGDSCDFPTLPASGTYTIWVDNGNWVSTFNLWLSTDRTATLTLNSATPTAFTTTRVGQNARYTFAGTAAQNLSLVLTGDTFPGYTYIYVYRPDGTQLTYTSLYYSSGAGTTGTLNLTNLPVTGPYTVWITPENLATGTINTRLITQ